MEQNRYHSLLDAICLGAAMVFAALLPSFCVNLIVSGPSVEFYAMLMLSGAIVGGVAWKIYRSTWKRPH
jgi:hypothetical protein